MNLLKLDIETSNIWTQEILNSVKKAIPYVIGKNTKSLLTLEILAINSGKIRCHSEVPKQ